MASRDGERGSAGPDLPRLWAASLAAVALDGGAAYLLWGWGVDSAAPWPWPALGLHVMASLSWAVAALLGHGGPERALGLLGAALALAVLPPLGGVTSGAVVLWLAHRRPRAPEGATAPGMEESRPTMSLRPGGVFLLARALEAQPLVDILRSEDLQLKASAIDVMARLGSGEMVAVLRSLLTAPEADVRFQASVALSRLEGRMGQAIEAAQERVRREPGSATAALELGRLYLDYATSGLLDPVTAGHYARLAVEQLERAARLDPSLGVTEDLARALAAAGEYDRVLEVLPPEDVVSDPSGERAMLRMEALYSLGRLEDLAREAAGAEQRYPLDRWDPERAALLRWWAEAAR